MDTYKVTINGVEIEITTWYSSQAKEIMNHGDLTLDMFFDLFCKICKNTKHLEPCFPLLDSVCKHFKVTKKLLIYSRYNDVSYVVNYENGRKKGKQYDFLVGLPGTLHSITTFDSIGRVTERRIKDSMYLENCVNMRIYAVFELNYIDDTEIYFGTFQKHDGRLISIDNGVEFKESPECTYLCIELMRECPVIGELVVSEM